MNIYESACEKAQEGLWNCFFDEKTGVMVNHMPVREEENWIYWWHAHALDALLDGYLRKTDGEYLERFRKEYAGTYRENGNTLLHNWYDDMAGASSGLGCDKGRRIQETGAFCLGGHQDCME